MGKLSLIPPKNSTIPDLEHADWLVYTTISMVQNVNPNIVTRFSKTENKRHLILYNVSEQDILNLYFLTNTDSNNNYLYLEEFVLFFNNNQSTGITIPGLKDLVLDIWRNTDANAFINEQKTYKPFNINYN